MSVFCKGANFIPIDAFASRVTADDRRYIMQAAVAGRKGGGRVLVL